MFKRMMLLIGAAVAIATVLVVGCGKETATTATGCDANLPCTVSTNIN